MGAIKRVDEFNTKWKNIFADMENITNNQIQRKNKYEKREVRHKQTWV